MNSRYVSAPEAMWRLLQYPMDEQSHTIIRLVVHLPYEQPVDFKPGSEEEALLKAEYSDSTLLAWFKLNQRDQSAHEHLYHNIPNYYTFYNKQ